MSNGSWAPIRWASYGLEATRTDPARAVVFHDAVGYSVDSLDIWLEDAAAMFADPWQFAAVGGRASITAQGPREIPFTVVSLADSAADIDALLALSNAAIAAAVNHSDAGALTDAPGVFSIALGDDDEPFTIRGYIVTRGVGAYDKREGLQRRELALITTETYWHKHAAEITAGTDPEAFDVASPEGADLILTASKYMSVHYVPLFATVRGAGNYRNSHGLNVEDENALTATIDTAARTATYTTAAWPYVNNGYSYRRGGAAGSGSYIFEPIPTAGAYTIESSSPNYPVTAQILERYGAPRW